MQSHEIKKQLGYGTLTKVAKSTGLTLGHVSQVVNGKRRSPTVERTVARRLGRKVAEVFPVEQDTAA